MDTLIDAKEFLQAVFGDDWREKAWLCNSGDWTRKTLEELDPRLDCYWCVGAIPWGKARKVENVENVRALVIDDVCTKVALEKVEEILWTPTATVATSINNYQWSYRLKEPVAPNAWRGFFNGIEALFGQKLDGGDAVHLFRLPMGYNTKPGKGEQVVQVDLNPGEVLDAADLPPMPEPSKPAASSESGDMGLDDLRGMMRMVVNNVERDEWVEIGHGLKALCADDEDGFAVFDEWSQWHPSYDAAKTRTAWDSFGASGLRSRGGMLRDRVEKSPAFAAKVFDDGVAAPPGPAGITATPYQWVDPDKLPLRDWLYGRILIRKFISITVAPGGVGKSSLVAVETLAQVTGQALLGEKPPKPLRVWLWNLEDPFEETQRKIQAAALRYGVSEADIGGRLFVDSGRDQRLVVAEMNGTKPVIVKPVVGALVEQIRLLGLDVVVVDPFVSCHEVPENDNTAQDMVVKEWGRVAELGNCAVHLIDHTSKAGSQEVVTDSSRGAKAKTDAARIVRVINRMTKDEGEKVFGVGEPWRYFHTFNDKANMAPPVNSRDWFHLESAWLGNGGGAAAAFAVGAGAVTGDSVGVVTRWTPPSVADLVTGDNFKAMVDAMGDKEWRKDLRTREKWIGNAAAQALNLDLNAPKDRAAIKNVLEQWFKAGLLKEVEQMDERRILKKFIKIAGGF